MTTSRLLWTAVGDRIAERSLFRSQVKLISSPSSSTSPSYSNCVAYSSAQNSLLYLFTLALSNSLRVWHLLYLSLAYLVVLVVSLYLSLLSAAAVSYLNPLIERALIHTGGKLANTTQENRTNGSFHTQTH